MHSLTIKKRVRARDGNRCTKCGMAGDVHKARYGRILEVHRVVPGSVYTEDGCVTLCKPCHNKEPRSPKRSTGRFNIMVPGRYRKTLRRLSPGLSMDMQVRVAVDYWLELHGITPPPRVVTVPRMV
jgi:hypothetical protein